MSEMYYSRPRAHGIQFPASIGPVRTSCPCCGSETNTPTLAMIIDIYRLSPRQERILRAIWAARGTTVNSERVFDIMYEHDPDGGPPSAKMHEHLKIGLCRLRKKLSGSGVGVETVRAGSRSGYRLTIERKEHVD